MRLSPSYLVAVAVAVISVAPAAALDPRVYEVDFVTGSRRSGLTKDDVREIRRFIRTIRGIDHNVRQIDGLQPAEVMVLTGRDYPDGDVVYIRKVDGRWTLLRKLRWRYAVKDDPTYGIVEY